MDDSENMNRKILECFIKDHKGRLPRQGDRECESELLTKRSRDDDLAGGSFCMLLLMYSRIISYNSFCDSMQSI